MTFGKRFAPPAPSRSAISNSGNLAETRDDGLEVHTGLPWAGSDYAPCNYAVGHLKDYLWSALSVNSGKPHTETLFSAIGSIAGIINQKHVFLKLRESGYMIAPPAIDTINARNGLTLYKGVALSSGLISDRKNKQEGLEFWPIILNAAISLGMDEDVLPTTDSMIKHIDEQVEVRQVQLRVGMHEQPILQPHELLKTVWPLVEKCFSGEIEQDASYGRAKLAYQCAICGFVAQQYLEMIDEQFPLGAALTISMESALYTSRLPSNFIS